MSNLFLNLMPKYEGSKKQKASLKIVEGAEKALFEGRAFSPVAAAKSAGDITHDYAEQISSHINKNKQSMELLDHVFPNEKILDIQAKQMNARILRRISFPKEIGGEGLDKELAERAINQIIENAGGVVSYILPMPSGNYLTFAVFDDNKAIDRALEKIYRLKGMNAPAEVKLKREFEDMDTEEMQEEIMRMEKELNIKRNSAKKENAIVGEILEDNK